MSTIDPGKLKVVELRAELTLRGLESKGNKPVLVQRLKKALEKESQTVLPDTSILDTSTEDSISQENLKIGDIDASEKEDEQLSEEATPKLLPDDSVSPTSKPTKSSVDNDNVDDKTELMETTIEEGNGATNEPEEPMDEDLKLEVIDETPLQDVPVERPKGEKRKHSSPSPQRNQRMRSISPVKEDEPELDNEKVSLSWYDSDLNLQIDKQSFLSAKPLNEGAFGYSWAGARTTHGVKVGKVCYEIKITEELKWDDIIKQLDRKRENPRSDRRDRRRSDRRGRETSRKGQETSKSDQLKVGKKESSTENKESSKEKSADDKETCIEQSVEYLDACVEKSTEETVSIKEELAEPLEGTISTEVAEETEKKFITEEPSKESNVTLAIEENNKDIKNDETSETVVSCPQDVGVTDKSDTGEPTENGNDTKASIKPESTEFDSSPPVSITKHVFRCGWSISGTSLQLGEAKYSYGFDSHGKFVHNNEFSNYGTPFTVGDVIGVYANIDDENIELNYSINGISQGLAVTIPRSEVLEDNFALFPHVLSRNLAFELNLGSREDPWFPHPLDLSDYIFIQAVEDKHQGPLRPASRSECEVIMMCGLPGSGKSHWVQELLKENSDKTYTIIGTSYLLNRMTINGNPLKDSYKNRWNIILDRLMKCANTLVDKAAVRRRNFIIDQTNVFPSAQRRKMRLFEGFKRRAMIVVVSDEEQSKRRAQQEAQDGKDVPDSALLDMKANMSLPKCSDWLEEVKYLELGEDEAKVIVQKYNAEGKAAGFGSFNRRGGFRDGRGHPYRWNRNSSRRDYRDNYRDGRSYQNNRYRSPGGFQDRRSAPGGWSRDFRDSRGPPRDPRNRSGSGSHRDRSSPRDRTSSNSYNRNNRTQGSRNQGSNWQGPGAQWQGNQNWGGSQGGVPYQNWNQGNWGGQGQWKGNSGYGQGAYGQGGYGNWNYYGQYANNWQN